VNVSEKTMTLQLKIWRQAGPNAPGSFMNYTAKGVTPDMSFLDDLPTAHAPL
jgi:succinate dehydrogenase / fumarate reductase iron-sulfur subunit